MRFSSRILLVGSLAFAVPLAVGCQGGNQRRLLQQSQLRTNQLYQQNRGLASERDSYGQSLAAVTGEKAQLEQQNAQLKQSLDLANQRLDNIASSNQQLEQKYQGLLRTVKNSPNPLTGDSIRRLEELRKKFPEFEFDAQTGVSKFHSDLLFASGSDELRPEGVRLLEEFGKIMNSNDARHLNILVVGHTDDKPISKAGTRAKHPTNWHLSTDRANSVVLTLKKSGVTESRMGAAGYSMYQPVTPNSDDKARQRNRRVEIFVLAPDASIAGWDPVNRLN